MKDLEVFVAVARAKSIREVARRQQLTSGQVSKIIQNIERRLGAKLFARSQAGVTLTTQGSLILEHAQLVLESGEKIEGLLVSTGRAKQERIFSVAGTSFVNTHFSVPALSALTSEKINAKLRFLDLPPDQTVVLGLRGTFEIAVHLSPLEWPGTWTTRKLGVSRWMLCARVGHPLAKRPRLAQVLEFPFVMPTYWTQEGLVQGTDQFPVSASKRKRGTETSTADAAVSVLRVSDQVAFLPGLVAKPLIERGELRELASNEIPIVERDVFLSVKSDVVPESLFQLMMKTLSAALK